MGAGVKDLQATFLTGLDQFVDVCGIEGADHAEDDDLVSHGFVFLMPASGYASREAFGVFAKSVVCGANP